MSEHDIGNTSSRRSAKLEELREALADATLREKLERPTDRYENDFAAGSFVAKLLLQARSLNPPATRERATAILREANLTTAVENLESRGFIRFPIGLLHIPHGVVMESLRRERMAEEKKNFGVMSADEELALRTLRTALRDSKPRFWLGKEEFEKIFQAHLKAHPQTPTFQSMCKEGFLSSFFKEGTDAVKFHFQRSGFEDPWLPVIERALALMWEKLCRDHSISSDDERLARWLDVANESPTMTETPSYLVPEFCDRLTEAIGNLLLSTNEATTLDEEARILRFEIDGGVQGDLRLKPVPDTLSGLGETFNWWQTPALQSIRVTGIGRLHRLVALVVQYDNAKKANRVVRLLQASVTHPYLLFAVTDCIEHVNAKAIAALITNPETASLGMHVLSGIDIVERRNGLLEDFEVRTQKLGQKRNRLWDLAVEVFLGTWHASGTLERFAWANMMYEVLLLAARTAAASESHQNQTSSTNEAEKRLDLLLKALSQFPYAELERLFAEFATLLQRSADPVRSNWLHIRNLPLAELRLAFWWLQVARGPEFREYIDPSGPANAILELYCAEMVRETMPNGKLIHWVDDAPVVAQLPWQDLALTMYQTHQIQRFLTPEDFSFARHLDVKDVAMEGDERSTLRVIWGTLMYKLRLHVRVLNKAYGQIRSGLSGQAELNELMSMIERRLIDLICTFSKQDPRSSRPSIFESDSTPLLGPGMLVRDTLASQVVHTFNEFRGPSRRTALESWIEIERDPVVLLTIFSDVLPVDARQKALGKLGTIDIDAFIDDQLWLPELQRFAEQASLAGRTDVVEKILVFGDERLKNHSLKSDWDLFAYQLRLRSASQMGDIEAIERVPLPHDLGRYRHNTNGKARDSVVESKKFFSGLALIQSSPIQAQKLFKDLRELRPGVWSDCVNSFAASIAIAQQEPDRAKRKEEFERVFEEWRSEREAMPFTELQNPVVQINELICYDGAERDREFDALWNDLGAAAQGRLEFVRVAVLCFSRRALPDRIQTVLENARPFYVDVHGKKTAEFEEIEKEAAAGHVTATAPSITDSQKDYTPDKLRRAYLEICDSLPEDVAQIFGNSRTPIHEFIWEQLHATAKEFLNQETVWKTLKLEDSHNDFFVSLFRMRVAFLKWQVPDQTRGGVSESGKEAGERDWMLRDSGKRGEIAIFEGLRLPGIDTRRINTHIDKLIQSYNPAGLTSLFFVVYYEGLRPFDDFWTAYVTHVTISGFVGLFPTEWIEDEAASSLSLRSILVIYRKDGLPIFLRHLVILVPKRD